LHPCGLECGPRCSPGSFLNVRQPFVRPSPSPSWRRDLLSGVVELDDKLVVRRAGVYAPGWHATRHACACVRVRFNPTPPSLPLLSCRLPLAASVNLGSLLLRPLPFPLSREPPLPQPPRSAALGRPRPRPRAALGPLPQPPRSAAPLQTWPRASLWASRPRPCCARPCTSEARGGAVALRVLGVGACRGWPAHVGGGARAGAPAVCVCVYGAAPVHGSDAQATANKGCCARPCKE
jgi:hypothetical protein